MNCVIGMCTQHRHESSDNSKTTLDKGGRNPPNITLDDILKNLSSFLNKFVSLDRASSKIEEKYNIEKEHDDCWPEDDIKRAWGKTQRMAEESYKRRDWALVILLQVIKRRLYYEECERKEAQSDQKEVKTSPILCYVGAEITPSEPKQVPSEISSPSEERDKMVKAKQNDDDDSNSKPTEEEESLVDLVEKLSVNEKENVKWIKLACGKAQRMKENPDDTSSQSNAKLQIAEQMEETAEQQSGADYTATKRRWTDNAGSESLLLTYSERGDLKVPKRPSLTKGDDGRWTRVGSDKSNSQKVYIRIPFSVMSGNESTSRPEAVPNDSPTYKLIDGVPNLTEINKKKSYAMLYDNQTKNAAWVYEILNSKTLKQEVKRQNDFSVDKSIHPFFRTSKDPYSDTYVRGHLAAAANHMWCQEALEDTFLMSNISPQHKDLNSGVWKTLENSCREKIRKNINEIRNVHVYSGPLYLPKDDKKVVNLKIRGGKAVPTHFFKVIIVEHNNGTVELECYEMPNEIDNKEYKVVSLEYIERASGLIFREGSCSEGETESLKEITWMGKYGETATTEVNISRPGTNVNTGLQ